MSTLRVNSLQNTSGAEMYTAKAWVNFNGTGTVAIRAAGNVSSITDNGTGNYTINFTTAMPDSNYAANMGWGYGVVGGPDNTQNNTAGFQITNSTNSFRCYFVNHTSDSATDVPFVMVSIFR